MQTYAYGHDFGNAETCGVVFYNGRRSANSIPSATAQGTLQRLESLGVVLDKKDYVFKPTDGPEMYVGQLALSQSDKSSTGRGDISRYWSARSLHLLLTVAASMIEDEEFGLSVVTGLPIQTYINDAESRNRVKTALNGKHTFYLNNKKRTIHVAVERVIMEGAGAIIAYGMKGNVRQGVIDIGGRTTDLFASNGQTPINYMCDGKPLGVELAADLLSANFQRLYGRPLNNDERRGILYAYPQHSNHTYPEIYVKGKPVTNLKELASQAIDSVGGDIASFVSTTWNESEQSGGVASSFARVLLVGGGAYFFHEQISKIIPEVQLASHPEEANALGYAAFAEGQFQRRQNIRIA